MTSSFCTGTIPALCAERAVDLHQRALRLPHHVPPLQALQGPQPVQPGKSIKLPIINTEFLPVASIGV